MDLDDLLQIIASIPDHLIDVSLTIDQLADLLVDNGIDVTEFSKDEMDQLLTICMNQDLSDDSSNIDLTSHAEPGPISFGRRLPEPDP